MRVVLQITSGSTAGRRIALQAGEVVRFGRTGSADVSFPHDEDMSSVHFVVECNLGQCRIQDLDSPLGTLLNGQKVTDARLQGGDHIQAGQTTFLVSIEGEMMPNDATDTTEDAQSSGNPPPAAAGPQPHPAETAEDDTSPVSPALTLTELCAKLQLDEESKELLSPDDTPDEFVETLATNEKLDDAVRVMAYTLPKRSAVWWGYLCVNKQSEDELPPPEAAALDAALHWIKEPNEDNRRASGVAAEALEFDGAASWVAVAAFWSGGSLAPPDLPEVAPDEALTSKAITAALIMAAARGGPEKIEDHYRDFIQTGREVTAGELAVPDA